MAERALTVFQGRVNMGLVRSDLFLAMAGIADLIPDLFENELGDDAVAKMTVLALPFLDDRMHILHGKIFFRKFSMAVKAILLLKFHRS